MNSPTAMTLSPSLREQIEKLVYCGHGNTGDADWKVRHSDFAAGCTPCHERFMLAEAVYAIAQQETRAHYEPMIAHIIGLLSNLTPAQPADTPRQGQDWDEGP